MNQLQKIDQEIAYWNRERLRLVHPLRQLFWECTLNCNLNCRHCGSDCKKDSAIKEMPLDDFLPVLDDIRLHQPEVKTIVITVGGEPLVRKDIVECGRSFTSKGFYWGMVTNAHLLDANMMSELSSAGLASLAVSLDGLREDHAWLRRSESNYDHVFNAIGHIRKAPHLSWDVITCVNRRNLPHLNDMKQMLIEAGVKKWRCFTIIPMGRAKNDDELVLSDDEFKHLLDFIVETRREKRIKLSYSCEGYLGDYEGLVRRTHFTCVAGLTTASVLSDGGISGCLSIRSQYRQGNIYTDSFWDVWQNRFAKYRNHDWMKTGECTDCEMFRYCQGNGFHLRNDDGSLMLCHYKKIRSLNIEL
ncbi:MAG: TIGR04133 family radical SAM/SPASM protein [Bacteroidaceae bacterium]|nr:TIGR04133 family radical SAM/SPASM protein [Bacteroidaceae bacterium]